MKFILLPILDIMIEFYQKPRNSERFQAYLQLLTNEKGNDLDLPIGIFNPMGKEHVFEMLQNLKNLDSEKIAQNVIFKINKLVEKEVDLSEIKVAINVADDLKGGWTNHFSTDYSTKFKSKAMIKRNFCTPIFWTSEKLNESIIQDRIEEYLYRIIYQKKHSTPKNLQEHIEQEAFVKAKMKLADEPIKGELSDILDFYEAEKMTENHAVIFNFLYGDEAAIAFGQPTLGFSDNFLGFKIASFLAKKTF